MDCQYCKKTFTTKSILLQHQKRAMYCLKIQGAEPTISYICKYCDKNFSRKDSYERHIMSHEKNEDFMKYQYELEKLREINRNLESIIEIKEASIESLTKQLTEKDAKILQLEMDMKEIAITVGSRPTTVNNTINVLQVLKNKEPLSLHHSSKLIDRITPEVINNPNIVQAYGSVFLEVLGNVPVIRDRSRGKTVSKLSSEVANKITDCRLIKNQPVLDDYYLKRTIKQMLQPEIISQHKAKVMEQAMIIMSKQQKDLEELDRFTEQIKMFEGINDNEITDTMEAVTRWCIQNLNRY